jgi:hypothetical protein
MSSTTLTKWKDPTFRSARLPRSAPDGHVGLRRSIAALGFAAIHLDPAADQIIKSDRLAWQSKAQCASVVSVDMPARLQLLRISAIYLPALTLPVRPALAADFRPFIPIQTEPAKPRVNRLQRELRVSSMVRVLDPQDAGAAVSPGEEPVKERRARSPDVQIARRRRGEANSNLA